MSVVSFVCAVAFPDWTYIAALVEIEILLRMRSGLHGGRWRRAAGPVLQLLFYMHANVICHHAVAAAVFRAPIGHHRYLYRARKTPWDKLRINPLQHLLSVH